MKCVGLQYLEAIRLLKASGFQPLRSVYLSFVPDEEIGGHGGAEKLAESDVFEKMNVGIILDEGEFLVQSSSVLLALESFVNGLGPLWFEIFWAFRMKTFEMVKFEIGHV